MKTYKIQHKEEAGLLVKMLLESTEKEGNIHIGLPGGRSIIPIIEAWKDLGDNLLKRLHLYLVDERLEGEKNAGTIQKHLLDELVKDGRIGEEQVHFPQIKDDDAATLAAYKEQLPERFDLLIFGAGEDGHIASLFPGHDELDAEERAVLVTDSPKPPAKRISLTFSACNRDATIVLLFLGDAKKEALQGFLEEDYHDCPAAYFEDYEELHLITDQDVKL
ncbi:MAG: 6-phosphogluconolactonase [Nanoarchaeota archaeon]